MSTHPERFPRSPELPTQSPLFWVEQKDRYLRQLLIRDIETRTGRRLIVYFANRFEDAQIDARDPSLLTELLRDIGTSGVDLLLETSGGQTDATEALIALLQNQISDLRVIVPKSAKSNGTLLCLAARKIAMGPVSELGPIEPLIQHVPCSILEQPEVKAQNFVLHRLGQYALQQTRTLATKLLSSGMMNSRPAAEIEAVVTALSSRDKYFSHGSVIDYKEAMALGLSVEFLPPGDPVWERAWLLYCMYDHDCRRNRYLKVFEGRAISTAVAVPSKS